MTTFFYKNYLIDWHCGAFCSLWPLSSLFKTFTKSWRNNIFFFRSTQIMQENHFSSYSKHSPAAPTSVRWGLGLKPHWLHTMERHCVQVLTLDLSSWMPVRSVVLQTGHSLLLGMGAIWGTEYGDVGTLPLSGETEGDLPLLPPTSTWRFLLATWPWPASPCGAACWRVTWAANLSPVPWPLWTPVLGPGSSCCGLVKK